MVERARGFRGHTRRNIASDYDVSEDAFFAGVSEGDTRQRVDLRATVKRRPELEGSASELVKGENFPDLESAELAGDQVGYRWVRLTRAMDHVVGIGDDEGLSLGANGRDDLRGEVWGTPHGPVVGATRVRSIAG